MFIIIKVWGAVLSQAYSFKKGSLTCWTGDDAEAKAGVANKIFAASFGRRRLITRDLGSVLFRLQQRTVASKHEESFSVLGAYRCFLLEIHQSSRTPSNPDWNSKSVKTEKPLETLIWFLQVSAHTHVQLSLCSVKFPFIYFIAKSVIWSEECGVLKLEQLAAEQCRTPHRNKKIPHWKWSQRSEVLYLRGHLCCGFIQSCTAMCKRLVTNTSLLTSA